MGGSDLSINRMSLTPEEHFVAHQLLVKIYPDNRKLILAANRMCSGNGRNNRLYGWLRRQLSITSSGVGNAMYRKRHTEESKKKISRKGSENAFFGKQHTIDTKNKISLKNTGKPSLSGSMNGMYGKSHTEDAIQKISKSSTGRLPWNKGIEGCFTADAIEKIRNSSMGRFHSDETKIKLQHPKGKQVLVSCVYCKKTGGISNMRKYHLDMCKDKK